LPVTYSTPSASWTVLSPNLSSRRLPGTRCNKGFTVRDLTAVYHDGDYEIYGTSKKITNDNANTINQIHCTKLYYHMTDLKYYVT